MESINFERKITSISLGPVEVIRLQQDILFAIVNQ
jgi:hypothetical protein